MDKRKILIKDYVPPRITSDELELECGVAAASATMQPGGGPEISSPWVTEETEETINKDWGFFD